MPAVADVLATLHLLLQISFTGVTLLLLVVTLMNRMRVRNVLLSWRQSRFFGLPVWPTLFLLAVLAFCLSSFAIKHVVPLELIVGYLLGGLFWFAAGLLSTTVLVTEYGLVFHANKDVQAVAWGQMVDYFKASTSRPHYVFFYKDPSGQRRRLEVTVPRPREAAFNRILDGKLDARFAPDPHHLAIGTRGTAD